MGADGEGLVADLRALLADGRCLCSSAHTDWRGVEDLLDRLEAAEAAAAGAWRLVEIWHNFGGSLRYGQELAAALNPPETAAKARSEGSAS